MKPEIKQLIAKYNAEISRLRSNHHLFVKDAQTQADAQIETLQSVIKDLRALKIQDSFLTL